MNELKRRIIYIVILAACNTQAFSQGAWNIRYLSIDAVNPSLIGKEIRIDFKALETDTLHGEANALRIRKLLVTKDTVNLTLNNKPVKFMEHWQLYVDQGILADQYLESINTDKKEKIYLKGMVLDSINKDTFTVLITVYGPGNKSKGQQRITVPQSIVKGILVATD